MPKNRYMVVRFMIVKTKARRFGLTIGREKPITWINTEKKLLITQEFIVLKQRFN